MRACARTRACNLPYHVSGSRDGAPDRPDRCSVLALRHVHFLASRLFVFTDRAAKSARGSFAHFLPTTHPITRPSNKSRRENRTKSKTHTPSSAQASSTFTPLREKVMEENVKYNRPIYTLEKTSENASPKKKKTTRRVHLLTGCVLKMSGQRGNYSAFGSHT